MFNNIAIILAAGIGKRFGNSTPKQYCLLNNKKVIDYSINTFINHKDINKVILVCSDEWINVLINEYPDCLIIKGGDTRRESSYNGLKACPKNTLNVLIHDAVRPFVTKKIITESITKLKEFKAVNISIPSQDTIISTKNNLINKIPDRKNIYLSQTPQSFNYKTIIDAHLKYDGEEVNDDIKLVKKIGIECYNLAGSIYNIKITHNIDLILAEEIIKYNKKI